MKGLQKFCPALWFSGFFGLGFIVHLVRLISGVTVTVGDRPIPMATSLAIVVVFGTLSILLLFAGMKRPCDEKKTVCGH